MTKIEHGKYRVTWLNGKAQATWTEGKGDARARPRKELKDRNGLPFRSSATVPELRAALVAFAAKQAKEELRSNGTLIAGILDAYLEHRIADGKQAHPITTQIKALKGFFANTHPHDVTEALCKQYAAWRGLDKDGNQVLSSSTILSELTRLSTALSWAAKRDVVEGWRDERDVPVMWFPQPAPAKDRVLTEDEALRLIHATTEQHTRLFILLALYTGARRQAILELTWDRVDLDKCIVNYKVPEVVNLLVKTVKKGRSAPHIPDEIVGELRSAKEQAKSKFVIEREGRPVKSIRTSLEASVTRAGLEAGVGAHTLRHTFASWCEAMGVPATAVARALGHKKESTTKENYQHAQTAASKPATDAVASRMRLRSISGGKE